MSKIEHQSKMNTTIKTTIFSIILTIVFPLFTIAQESAEYYFQKGMDQLKIRQNDSAIYYFDLALKINPQYPDAAFRRGFAKDNSGLADEAYKDYTLAIDLGAKPVFFNNRGMVRFVQGKYEEAIVDYDHAIALDSNYLIALFNKGRAYVEMQNAEKGCIYMKEAFEKGLTVVEDAILFYCN